MYQSILFGYDASMRADTDLAQVVPIVQASGSELILVHCLDPHRLEREFLRPESHNAEPTTSVTVHSIALQRAASIRQLSSSAESLRASGWKSVKTVVLEAPPAEGIIALAHERGSDMIVLGDGGRSVYDRKRLGRVAEAVLLHSRCPVLVLRSA